MIDRLLSSLFCGHLFIGSQTLPVSPPNYFAMEPLGGLTTGPGSIESLLSGAQLSRSLHKHSQSGNSSNISRITPLPIAVALGPGTVGTQQEYAWLENLNRVASNSSSPKTFVHNLGLANTTSKSLCKDYRYNLVLFIEYRSEKEEAIVSSRDCLLDRELVARSIDAITQIDLVGQLWSEHQTLESRNSPSDRRLTLNPKLRLGLIAGSAALIIGGAIAIVFAATLRKDQAVLTVSPDVPIAR